MRIVIVGLGGIGTIFTNRLCRFINYTKAQNLAEVDMHLIDGDKYEMKNFERQEFMGLGNKAEIKARELTRKYPKINFTTYDQFINETNISDQIKEGDVVCLCVDNHKTRKVVSEFCKTLPSIILISGGNDWTDGNVQIYVRNEGKDLTPDLTMYHPEIADPKDKSPEDMSCEELAETDPQLYFANLFAATLMCCAFFNVVINGDIENSEAYFDIESMSARASQRVVK